MRHKLISLFLLQLIAIGFSQNANYNYTGRITPVIKKEKLNEASFVWQVMPELGRYLSLGYKERIQLDDVLRTMDRPKDYYGHPQENDASIFDFISVHVSVVLNGKPMVAESKGELLSEKQKDILLLAGAGSEIHMKIKFSYKINVNDGLYDVKKVKEGEYAVTVVPDTEAEYPGGYLQVIQFLREKVMDKNTGKGTDKIGPAVIKFTVNESGEVEEVELVRRSSDLKTDKLLMDAAYKMQRWKPAKNAKGEKVKQDFHIPLGFAGC